MLNCPNVIVFCTFPEKITNSLFLHYYDTNHTKSYLLFYTVLEENLWEELPLLFCIGSFDLRCLGLLEILFDIFCPVNCISLQSCCPYSFINFVSAVIYLDSA